MDDDVKALARRLVEQGVLWVGQPATASDIAAVEARVGLTIPAPYRDFLMTFGGGVVAGDCISGVFGDEPESEGFGTILGDTFRLRELMDLPARLLVVRNGDDEVPWCLDTAASSEDREPPMVTFDRGMIERLYSGFDEFFVEYLRSWA